MKTKVIATILFILVLLILVPEVIGVAGEDYPDTECLTPWIELRVDQGSSYCNDIGTYTLYSCQINGWSTFTETWYTTINYSSTCGYQNWLPIIQKQSSIIGTPICLPSEICQD